MLSWQWSSAVAGLCSSQACDMHCAATAGSSCSTPWVSLSVDVLALCDFNLGGYAAPVLPGASLHWVPHLASGSTQQPSQSETVPAASPGTMYESYLRTGHTQLCGVCVHRLRMLGSASQRMPTRYSRVAIYSSTVQAQVEQLKQGCKAQGHSKCGVLTHGCPAQHEPSGQPADSSIQDGP
jgi:hypothetical protein